MKLSDNERKANLLILAEVEKALDLLQTHLHKYCDTIVPSLTGAQGKSVPLFYIDQSIKTIKTSYRNAIENTNGPTEPLSGETQPKAVS